MPDYTTQRSAKTPPHATMRGVRKAAGLTLEQVAEAVNEILGTNANRGTISAIELGIRGASAPMLEALAVAYGMEPGDLTTDYAPRQREMPEAVGQ